MIIVNIAPNSPYNDYWGYQDNLLPKYQRKMGHDVTMITTTKMHQDGKLVEIAPTNYVLDDGVKVYRCGYKKCPVSKLTDVLSFIPVYDLLNDIKPDFIFYHGLISATILDVIKYKKLHKECVIVEDNHMDQNNYRGDVGLFGRLRGIWYRYINRRSIKYVDRVYGVTPWRKTYAEEYFGIPKSKTDVLIMGADDEKIDFSNRNQIKKTIRTEYGIKDDDFLIVSGGKIDKKKGIDVLAEACASLSQDIKLLLFGSIDNEIKEKMRQIFNRSDKIKYIGWIDSDQVYNFFLAADLVFFPGGHSVLWEQACACKVPCVFKSWYGADHLNCCGNSVFIEEINEQAIKEKILELFNTERYKEIKMAAESNGTDVYLYSQIAMKSLECK